MGKILVVCFLCVFEKKKFFSLICMYFMLSTIIILSNQYFDMQ